MGIVTVTGKYCHHNEPRACVAEPAPQPMMVFPEQVQVLAEGSTGVACIKASQVSVEQLDEEAPRPQFPHHEADEEAQVEGKGRTGSSYLCLVCPKVGRLGVCHSWSTGRVA